MPGGLPAVASDESTCAVLAPLLVIRPHMLLQLNPAREPGWLSIADL